MATRATQKIWYQIQHLFILLIHLVLLAWIYYTLQNAGEMSTLVAFLHFLGIGSYGGLLIFGTASWAKWHHRKANQ